MSVIIGFLIAHNVMSVIVGFLLTHNIMSVILDFLTAHNIISVIVGFLIAHNGMSVIVGFLIVRNVSTDSFVFLLAFIVWEFYFPKFLLKFPNFLAQFFLYWLFSSKIEVENLKLVATWWQCFCTNKIEFYLTMKKRSHRHLMDLYLTEQTLKTWYRGDLALKNMLFPTNCL